MTYGVKELCERYGVGEHTVLGWIHRSELHAIDVSRRQGGRPKWRITQQALDAFETLRSATPQEPSTPTRRRRRQTNSVEFY